MKSFIKIYNEYSETKIFWVSYVALYAVIGLLVGVLCQTFMKHSPPVVIKSNDIHTFRRNDVVVIHYDRTSHHSENFYGFFQREIVNLENNWTFDLPINYRQNTIGEFEKRGEYIIPPDAPNGTYILRTRIYWQPKLSLSYQEYQMPDVRFKICSEINKECK